MIGIIDYGAGNLKSVAKAFEFLGHPVTISEDAAFLNTCDKLVLPGVGAFSDCMAQLQARQLDRVVKCAAENHTPLLGICLGLQLLFESSEEGGPCKGLGILKGHIKKIPDRGLKIPQIGWNNIQKTKPSRILDGIYDDYFYFVHSYYLEAQNRSDVAATCEYGVTLDVACERGNLFATQFHPEKSSEGGLRVLNNFAAV